MRYAFSDLDLLPHFPPTHTCDAFVDIAIATLSRIGLCRDLVCQARGTSFTYAVHSFSCMGKVQGVFQSKSNSEVVEWR